MQQCWLGALGELNEAADATAQAIDADGAPAMMDRANGIISEAGQRMNVCSEMLAAAR